MYRPAKTCEIHPISAKLIHQGHPWILKDSFTNNFPERDWLFVALNRRRPCALVINDPEHDLIKARVWSTRGDFNQQFNNFKRDLEMRMLTAMQRRLQNKIHLERENYYLIFGEADFLPGLFVQFLNGHILIQFMTRFWIKYDKMIIKIISTFIFKNFHYELESSQIWIQDRSQTEGFQKAICQNINMSESEHIVSEFGVKYIVQFGKNYDVGLFTDMSSVRKKIKNHIKANDKVLNLYSYTGAFSLMANHLNASEVHSVDLSHKYLEHFKKNLELNNMDLKKNIIHEKDAYGACQDLIKRNIKFNVIIIDPPTTSSDKRFRSNAFDEYKRLMPLLVDLLEPQGKMIMFVNTHKVYRDRFQVKVQEILVDTKTKPLLIQKERLQLGEDCPTYNGFPEGDYLKGLVFEKISLPKNQNVHESKNEPRNEQKFNDHKSSNQNPRVQEQPKKVIRIDYKWTYKNEEKQTELKSDIKNQTEAPMETKVLIPNKLNESNTSHELVMENKLAPTNDPAIAVEATIIEPKIEVSPLTEEKTIIAISPIPKKKATKKVVKVTTQKAVKKVTKKVTKKVDEKPKAKIEKVKKAVSDKKKISKAPSDKVAKKVAKKVTKKVTKKITKKVTKKVIKK